MNNVRIPDGCSKHEALTLDAGGSDRTERNYRCPIHPDRGWLVRVAPDESPPAAEGLATNDPGLRCSTCGRTYAVRDGIPELVLDQDCPEGFLETEARQWDEQAHRYEEQRSRDFCYMAAVDAAVEALQVQPGDTVLDAGCGTGFTVRRYLRPNVRVVGLDLSLESLRYLRSSLGETEVDLVRATLTRLPFADGTFDKVLCHNAVQQVPDEARRRQCVRELARVARPGARVVITAQNWSPARKSAGWVKEGVTGSLSHQLQYIYRYEPADFQALLASALQVQRVRGAGFPLPYRFKLSPLSRALERLFRRFDAGAAYGDILVGIANRTPVSEPLRQD